MLEDHSYSQDILDRIAGDNIGLATLLYADFPDDPVYIWNGYENLSYDGQTWQPVGELIDINIPEESTDTASRPMDITMHGMEVLEFGPSVLDGVDYQGRAAEVRLLFYDWGLEQPVDDIILFSGIMDSDEISDEPNAVGIKFRVVRRDADLLRPRPLRWSHSDQQFLHPDANDFGLEFAPLVTQVNVKWKII